MNFNLIDIQGLLNKKKEVSSLGKPTLEKAFYNGQADQNVLGMYPSYTHYERILRNSFQIKVNNNYKKQQQKFNLSQRKSEKVKALDEAAKSERDIYKEYIEHVKEYKKGLSRQSDEYNSNPTQKKKRKVKTEIIFCFDASFGMYHLSLFQAVNKFIDLLNAVDLEQIDVAIIAYGSGVTTVSKFTHSKSKLLFSTSMILPVGGVTVLFENFKLATVSDNDLYLALFKADKMFHDSKNAVNDIKRHVVVLSDGNLSGIVGSDLEMYDIDKNELSSENLEKILEVKKSLVAKNITLSSIALKGDNSNIIRELSEIIFWEDNVKKINANVGLDIEKTETKSQKLIDLQEYENRLRDTMKLNLKYIQQEQYKGDMNV